jgi:hypothetical protein
MPLVCSKSPVLGIVLIVERTYRGLHAPESVAANALVAGGGCVAAPD